MISYSPKSIYDRFRGGLEARIRKLRLLGFAAELDNDLVKGLTDRLVESTLIADRIARERDAAMADATSLYNQLANVSRERRALQRENARLLKDRGDCACQRDEQDECCPVHGISLREMRDAWAKCANERGLARRFARAWKALAKDEWSERRRLQRVLTTRELQMANEAAIHSKVVESRNQAIRQMRVERDEAKRVAREAQDANRALVKAACARDDELCSAESERDAVIARAEDAESSLEEERRGGKYFVKARVYGAIAARFAQALKDIGTPAAQAALAWRHSENGGVPMRAISDIEKLLDAERRAEAAEAKLAEHQPAEHHADLLTVVAEARAWCDDPDDLDGVPHVCALLDAIDGMSKQQPATAGRQCDSECVHSRFMRNGFRCAIGQVTGSMRPSNCEKYYAPVTTAPSRGL